MLTYEELVSQIRRRSLQERLTLLEELAHSVKEDLVFDQKSNSTPGENISDGEKVNEPAPVTAQLDKTQYEQLASKLGITPEIPAGFGMLNPEGHQYTDEELDQIRYEALMEKYS